MSLALHTDLLDLFTFRRHVRLAAQDPCQFEQELSEGDHPGFIIEWMEGSLALIFGQRYPYTPARDVTLHASGRAWKDRHVVEAFGGLSRCRLHPCNLLPLLAEFWPEARQDYKENGPDAGYLACLVECATYQQDYIVTAHMGQRGYFLKPFPYGAIGDFGGNVQFAFPV